MRTIDTAGNLYLRDTSAGLHDIAPVRGTRTPLSVVMNDREYTCGMCHIELVERLREKALKEDHKNIRFRHGANLLCLNCHNSDNPDTFVNQDGSPIPAAQSSILCGKCHSSRMDEWRIGIHGRQNGHWDVKFGEQVNLDCIQCHDPHTPRFPKMKPEPPLVLSRFDRSKTREDSHAGH